jgi:LmbE family N-acetylglucosaminyl deacetylase
VRAGTQNVGLAEIEVYGIPTDDDIDDPAVDCSRGAEMFFSAHTDDDLLFMSPDLLRAIRNGMCVRTVVLTAGDAGQSASYWRSREDGHHAAYAQMAGVPNNWETTDAGVPGHPMPLSTLVGNPRISLVHMRLPDGNIDGTGFASTGNVSLTRLWIEEISSIGTMDNSSTYTDQSLKDTLRRLMSDYAPTAISTLNYQSGVGDHADHLASALYAREARLEGGSAAPLTGYIGYPTSSLPANVSGSDLAAKDDAFDAYAQYDEDICTNPADCALYESWLRRQYTVG